MSLKLLILPGDGIGPEVIAATAYILKTATGLFSLDITAETGVVGEQAAAEHGTQLPQAIVDNARTADGIVLGPTRKPGFDGDDAPSAATTLCQALDLHTALKPIRSYAGFAPVRAGLDIVLVSDLPDTTIPGGRAASGHLAGQIDMMPIGDAAIGLSTVTRDAVRRVADTACMQAAMRRGRLVIAHDADHAPLTEGLFLDAARQAGAGNPAVTVGDMTLETAAAELVRMPEDFDVILTRAVHAPVLAGAAEALAESRFIGGPVIVGDDRVMAEIDPGGDGGDSTRGSANPVPVILAVAKMLDWLGARRDAIELGAAAAAIEAGVEVALSQSENRPPQLGGEAGGAPLARAIAKAMIEAVKSVDA